MVQFIKKNWFYIGLVALGVVYFRKELGGYINKPASGTAQEKFTQASPDAAAGGQSLFSMGAEAATAGSLLPMPEVGPETAKSFLRRFAKVAQGEQQKFNIPASAFLALAYVNSHGGQRALVGQGNNYFAWICSNTWEGESLTAGSACFRKYEKPWDSYRDASSHLAATRWAHELVKQKEKGWEKWIEAFEENGYSDVKNAKKEMEKVIKSYRLFELDAQ